MWKLAFSVLLAGGPATNATPVQHWGTTTYATEAECIADEPRVHAWYSPAAGDKRSAVITYRCEPVPAAGAG